jgi:hypothetical protein
MAGHLVLEYDILRGGPFQFRAVLNQPKCQRDWSRKVGMAVEDSFHMDALMNVRVMIRGINHHLIHSALG